MDTKFLVTHYEEIDKFVNQYLFAHCKTYYENPRYHDDLVSTAMLIVCENIGKYDGSFSIKAFLTPYMKMGMLHFCKNENGTSEYYERQKIKLKRLKERKALKGDKVAGFNFSKELSVSKKTADRYEFISNATATKPLTAEEPERFNLEEHVISNQMYERLMKVIDSLPKESSEILKIKAESDSRAEFHEKLESAGFKPKEAKNLLCKARRSARRLVQSEHLYNELYTA